MSTKIYNGFKLKNLNLKDLKDFTKELSDLAYQKFVQTWNSDFANKIEAFVDGLVIADSNNDFSEVQKILENYHMLRYSTKRLVNTVRYRKDVSELYHPDLLKEYKWTSIQRLIYSLKEEDILIGQIHPTIMDDYIHASIVLFPMTKNTCLMMTFSDDFTEWVYEMLTDEKYTEFVEKYGLCDYHYQNQTDRPKRISAREWNKRNKDWDFVCPGAPSDCGIVIDLLDADKFLAKTFFIMPETFKSPEVRAKRKAKDILLDRYCRFIGVNFNSFSEVINASKQFKAELKNDNSEWAFQFTQLCNELEQKLPVINKEFIEKNVLDLISNFKKHLENKTEE